MTDVMRSAEFLRELFGFMDSRCVGRAVCGRRRSVRARSTLRTPMHIRRASLEDAHAVAALAGELGYPTEPAAMRVRLEPLLESADDAVFVAVTGIAVVGWAHVAALRMMEAEPRAELRGLIVTEALRSRGVGLRLLEAAESWARSRGLSRIRVRSNVVRERTHAFYLRNGYATAKSQKVFDKILQ